MDAEFRPRRSWKTNTGPGRPSQECPEPLLDLIRKAIERPDDVVVISAAGSAKHERRRVATLLKRGAETLGEKIQVSTDSKEICFYVEGPEHEH